MLDPKRGDKRGEKGYMGNMRKKLTGILIALLTVIAVCSMAFTEPDSADAAGSMSSSMASELTSDEPPSDRQAAVSFRAKLQFDSAMDDHVTLVLKNDGQKELRIGTQAHYMDQIGSAGSWDCTAQQEAIVQPGNTVHMKFTMDQAAAHGENSILAFYFQYEGAWYLAKVGERNGVEYFARHN